MTAARGQAAATPRGTAAAAATVTAEPVAADLPVAPDFTLRTLDGGTFSLAAKRGTPVVLNFWAPW
jgi:cytochrome oxidase Cu insertion factor (SCO1/SenC/PrrC family)